MGRSGGIRQRRTMRRLVWFPGRGQFHEAADVVLQVHVAADRNHRVDAVVPFQPADLGAVNEATVYQQHLHYAAKPTAARNVSNSGQSAAASDSFSRNTR